MLITLGNFSRDDGCDYSNVGRNGKRGAREIRRPVPSERLISSVIIISVHMPRALYVQEGF